MTIWKPEASALRRPAYLALANQVANAISQGSLSDGARMLTQRAMAKELGISVQTVSRAYEELIRRGLLSGETGRGTFVKALKREPEPPYIPERLGEVIDMSILKPICDPLHMKAMKTALAHLAETIPSSAVFSFRPNVVFPRHRAVALEWLKACGLTTSALNVSLTNGATAGMTVALMSTAARGSCVATEQVGHHTLVPLASYLGLSLKDVAIDDQGMVPDALDRLCREMSVRSVFVQPTAINPTATTMGAERRARLVAVARSYDLAIIENDVLGPLVADRPPPLAQLAPERTLYITSFSKIVMPGLRIGYLVVPDRYVAAATNRHLVTNWMATPLVAEIATRWVEDGTAMRLVRWQRDALHRRHAVAAEVLDQVTFRSQPESLHIWLPLNPGRSESTFVSQARLQGVAIAPGASFWTGADPSPPAVRISLGSITEGELRTGLRIVGTLLRAPPEPLLLAI